MCVWQTALLRFWQLRYVEVKPHVLVYRVSEKAPIRGHHALTKDTKCFAREVGDDVEIVIASTGKEFLLRATNANDASAWVRAITAATKDAATPAQLLKMSHTLQKAGKLPGAVRLCACGGRGGRLAAGCCAWWDRSVCGSMPGTGLASQVKEGIDEAILWRPQDHVKLHDMMTKLAGGRSTAVGGGARGSSRGFPSVATGTVRKKTRRWLPLCPSSPQTQSAMSQRRVRRR